MSDYVSKKQKEMMMDYAKTDGAVTLTLEEINKLLKEIEDFRAYSDKLQEKLNVPQDEEWRKRFKALEGTLYRIIDRTGPKAQATTLVFNFKECFDAVNSLAFDGMRHIPELGEEYRK